MAGDRRREAEQGGVGSLRHAAGLRRHPPPADAGRPRRPLRGLDARSGGAGQHGAGRGPRRRARRSPPRGDRHPGRRPGAALAGGDRRPARPPARGQRHAPRPAERHALPLPHPAPLPALLQRRARACRRIASSASLPFDRSGERDPAGVGGRSAPAPHRLRHHGHRLQRPARSLPGIRRRPGRPAAEPDRDRRERRRPGPPRAPAGQRPGGALHPPVPAPPPLRPGADPRRLGHGDRRPGRRPAPGGGAGLGRPAGERRPLRGPRRGARRPGAGGDGAGACATPCATCWPIPPTAETPPGCGTSSQALPGLEAGVALLEALGAGRRRRAPAAARAPSGGAGPSGGVR